MLSGSLYHGIFNPDRMLANISETWKVQVCVPTMVEFQTVGAYCNTPLQIPQPKLQVCSHALWRKRQPENLKTHIPDFFRSFAVRMLQKAATFLLRIQGLKGQVFLLLWILTILTSQAARANQTTSDLRKQLGIPSNEDLLQQNEEEFLSMLHQEVPKVFFNEQNKKLFSILAKELSHFARQQQKKGKLRCQMLEFWFRCISGYRDEVLYEEMLSEFADAGQKNLRVNLILLNYTFANISTHNLLIENFWQMHEAVDLILNEPDEVITNRGKLLYNMGSLFIQVGDMPNALSYLKRSTKNAPDGLLKLSFNTIGFVYKKLKMYDSSNHYFEKTLSIADKFKDSVFLGLSSGNLGENYYLQGQYDKAIPLLETDAAIALALNDYGVASNAELLLSEISLRQGKNEKARVLLAIGRKNAIRSGQYHRLQLLYATSALFYTTTGQIERAIIAYDSLKQVSDSLDTKEASISSLNPELVYQSRLSNERALQLKIENDNSLQKRNLLLLGLVGVLIIGGLSFWIFRLRSRLRMNLVVKYNQTLELNVAEFKVAMELMAENLTESTRQLCHLKDAKSDMAEQELKALVKIADAQWVDFRSLFEQVHPGFLSRIKVKIPNLTPSEIRFMMLVRMHVKDSRMAEMQGVGHEAIRKTRSRLKQKIAFLDGEALEEFILSV
jgi:tetratricopeptide (TPR) repeat protein